LRIYLDNCAYNRPYDDFTQLTVSLEAQAKLHIQSWIRDGQYELVSSEILMAEIGCCPFEVRRKGITDYIEENSSIHVGSSHNFEIDETAREIMSTGIKYKDACHVASAMLAGCEYLITTDKRLLRYKSEKLKLVNPIQFVDEMEEITYER
jgi:predicted nucleic acid-binding protein